MRDAIVIGKGIIGATVAQALRKQGRDVLLLDDDRPMGGTPPSGGHLKPSWLGGMPKSEYEPAMQLLDDIWHLHESQFVIRPLKVVKTTVYRVDTDLVRQVLYTKATVTALEFLHNFPAVTFAYPEETVVERCRLLVIAAGVWCSELVGQVPDASIQRKQGVSFRFLGKATPFIKPWTPYKQVVAHQQGPNEVWVGDGSAILESNWDQDRTQQCLARCKAALNFKHPPMKVLMGLRPYCATPGKDPCLLRQLGPRAWVATGAGKSGTISGGWVARRILDATS